MSYLRRLLAFPFGNILTNQVQIFFIQLSFFFAFLSALTLSSFAPLFLVFDLVFIFIIFIDNEAFPNLPKVVCMISYCPEQL